MNENKLKWELNQRKNEAYVWYDNLFDEDELKKIQSHSKDKDLSVSNITGVGLNNKKNTNVRKSDTRFLLPEKQLNNFVFEKIGDLINEANNTWFNFRLDHLENLQYTVYKSNQKQFYKSHVDTILDNFSNTTRKLSFSLLLNDNYEGGDLNLYYSSHPTTVEKKRGRIYFFPSYVLHEVTPVTKGTRQSLVGWVRGPHFQ